MGDSPRSFPSPAVEEATTSPPLQIRLCINHSVSGYTDKTIVVASTASVGDLKNNHFAGIAGEADKIRIIHQGRALNDDTALRTLLPPRRASDIAIDPSAASSSSSSSPSHHPSSTTALVLHVQVSVADPPRAPLRSPEIADKDDVWLYVLYGVAASLLLLAWRWRVLHPEQFDALSLCTLHAVSYIWVYLVATSCAGALSSAGAYILSRIARQGVPSTEDSQTRPHAE